MALTNNLFNETDYAIATLNVNQELQIKNAVNEVLESIGEFPVSTYPLDPKGTMIHERALRFLERANISIQQEGWPVNTEMSVEFDASGTLDDAPPILRIQGSGRHGHRSLSLRRISATGAPEIWDNDTGDVNTESAVYLDVVRKVAFEYLPELLRSNIISAAAQDMQRRLQGSPQADAFYQQEKVLVDSLQQRLNPMKKNLPLMNTQPLQQQSQPQQGQG